MWVECPRKVAKVAGLLGAIEEGHIRGTAVWTEVTLEAADLGCYPGSALALLCNLEKYSSSLWAYFHICKRRKWRLPEPRQLQ